jgi:penicillin-binding protein 1A
VIIRKIKGPGGQPVALPPAPPSRRVMEPEVAYLTTSLMRSVVEVGTARRAQSLGRPVAGKTGTTNDARDAWFVGYSTDIVAAVWVGYDDAVPLGPGESGAATALPAWVEFMKAAHRDKPKTSFPRPGSIVVVRIDPSTGLLARVDQEDAVEEEFLDGTAPTEVAAQEGEEPEEAEAEGVAESSEEKEPSGSTPESDSHPQPTPTAGAAPSASATEVPDVADEPPPF